MKIQSSHPDATILIVDDSPDNVLLLKRILELAGYQIIHSTLDPRQAPGLYAELEPDVVLLDLNMPHMDGFDVIDRLKDIVNGGDLPVLMLTAQNDRDIKLKALEAGAKDFLTKPFDRLEVLTRIRNIIENHRLHRTLYEQNNRLDEAVRERTRELQIEIQSRMQAEERTRYQALHDALTGLPNRTLFNNRLQDALEAANGQGESVAVILLDLDRFQEINDTLGHENGDLLIQQVTQRLKRCVQHSGVLSSAVSPKTQHTIARFGGDEFAIALPAPDAIVLANQFSQCIHQTLSEPFELAGLVLDVSGSIGIAAFPDHGADVNILIQRADVAMYAAKKQRHTTVLYSEEHDHYSTLRLTLMAELRHAIAQNSLELHYQPKIDLSTGRVSGVEALTRWIHDEHGFIPPDQFIPMAEETGTIKLLTDWVLATAIRQCAEFQRQGLPLSVAVNLSTRDLMDKDLAERLATLIDQYQVEPSGLILEVTESAMMKDPEQALELITQIHQMGIRFAVDDFGTGYSSLAYLKRLPVTELKIDRSFVADMDTDNDNATIVQSTIDLAHNLGLQVVAEGIEGERIWNQLDDLGCDTGQGYYMSRPLPLDKLQEWLASSPWGIQALSAIPETG